MVSSLIGKMEFKNTIFRFMLKSLGQWTSLSLKPRKIIPSTLTLVPSKPSERGQGEPVTLRHETKYVNFFKLFYSMNSEFFFFINFYPITFLHLITFSRDNILTTPKGRILNLQPSVIDGESVRTSDEYEQLVAIQGEERSPMDEDFNKVMKLM